MKSADEVTCKRCLSVLPPLVCRDLISMYDWCEQLVTEDCLPSPLSQYNYPSARPLLSSKYNLTRAAARFPLSRSLLALRPLSSPIATAVTVAVSRSGSGSATPPPVYTR